MVNKYLRELGTHSDTIKCYHSKNKNLLENYIKILITYYYYLLPINLQNNKVDLSYFQNTINC